MTIDPFERVSLSVVLANRLREQIRQGHLRPGERLPGHRELAKMFSVGVGSVREAISMLVNEGLVETRVGHGTFVARDADSSKGTLVRHPLDRKQIEELIEAREVLELELVALAAQRASAQQIRDMESIVEQMQSVALDPQAFTEADVELHLAIAEAAGNRFLLQAMKNTSSILKRDMELSAEVGVRRLGSLEFSVDTHRRLVAAIAASDADKARQVMLNILRRNHEFVLSLYSPVDVSMNASGEL